MPIVTPELPPRTVDAVRRAVAATGRYPRRRGSALSLSSPHPIYTIGLESLAAGRPLVDAAELTGWRALLEEDQKVVAAAEVPADDSKTTGASINRGAFVDSTVEALSMAERHDRVASEHIELRLLRVPGLYLLALWLHADDGNDLYIPLSPAPPPLSTDVAHESPSFERDLSQMAQSVLSTYQAAERPDELGS